MTQSRIGAIRAVLDGLGLTLRAPGLMLVILLLTIMSAIPFAFVIEPQIRESLALQAPGPAVGASEIDPEWWLEFRRHASGLAATFTPAILGFAAPLDTVSGLLDGSRRPIALAVPVAFAAAIWAFLWGGVLDRFASGISSVRAFRAAGARHFPRMLALTLFAGAANLAMYLTLHAVLFEVIYESLAARVSSERNAFLIRLVAYVVFGAGLVLVNAVVSFARIAIVTNQARSVIDAVTGAWQFVRTQVRTVASLYLIFIAVFTIAMVAYGATELAGGSRVGGWRAVVIGQVFIAFRLVLRVSLAASQVRLAVPPRA